MTDTNITNTSESTEALNEAFGQWWDGWQASGTGNYARPERYGPEYPDVPDCVKEINHAWAFFYGAQPCGDNGWEPSTAQTVEPNAVQTVLTAPFETQMVGSVPPPATPTEAAMLWASKCGDPLATVEEKKKDIYEMHGHFTDFGPVPPHAPVPTGTVMTVTVDPATNHVIWMALR